MVEDAQGPGRFLAGWGHIVAGRAEARAAASRISAWRCESARRSLVRCVGPDCVRKVNSYLVTFCNRSALRTKLPVAAVNDKGPFI